MTYIPEMPYNTQNANKKHHKIQKTPKHNKTQKTYTKYKYTNAGEYSQNAQIQDKYTNADACTNTE